MRWHGVVLMCCSPNSYHVNMTKYGLFCTGTEMVVMIVIEYVVKNPSAFINCNAPSTNLVII